MQEIDTDDIFASPKRKRVANNAGLQTQGSSQKKKAKKAKKTVTPDVSAKKSSSGGDFRSLAMDLPVSSFSTTGTSNDKKKQQQERSRSAEDAGSNTSGDFRSLAMNLPVSSFSTTGATNGKTKQPKQPKAVAEDVDSNTSGGFRTLVSSLPVASFSTTTNKTNNSTKTEKQPAPANLQATPPGTAEKKKKKKKKAILPNSTEAGKKWKNAVVRSREHPRYANAFEFANYKQKSKEAGVPAEWFTAKPYGKWCKNNPQSIAIDCEMCETTDPVSGAKNSKALCRLSVVNAERPDEVLLDTLVKPDWPVSDYRTRINGITEEHLKDVRFTLQHAQSFMMSLCSEETVIVGHAVHNDLAALNMEHHCIADSSFLFRAKDSADSSCSLKDVVYNIFKAKMPKTHDSVNDARKALECVLHWIKKDGKVGEIERSTFSARGVKLFVHRIPKQCKPEHFISMFERHTGIVPDEVDDIEFNGDTGKTHVHFKSLQLATLAFETLEGTPEPDKSGRLQKKVYLKGGGYVRIRKMVYERPENSKSDNERQKSP